MEMDQKEPLFGRELPQVFIPTPIDCGFSLKIDFVEPDKGPVCFGYGSHFGLGLFVGVG